MVCNMEKELGKDEFDVSTYLFACTLDMVCGTTLGYDVGVQCGQNQDYLEGIEKYVAKYVKEKNVFLNLLFSNQIINNDSTKDRQCFASF